VVSTWFVNSIIVHEKALGATYRVQTSPYQDEITPDDFIPLIIYNGEHTYLAGTSLGVHLVDNSIK
jgi:hypothetical protein